MDYKIKPWAHQLSCIERAKDKRHFALFFEMGTGKTGTTINILRHKFTEERRVLRTLILCPPIVIDNWRKEFGMHSKVAPDAIVPLVGSGAKRLKTFEKAIAGQGRIFITNYEALQMKPLMAALLAWAPEVLICDESQRLKNPKAVRTKLATQLADLARFKYILSGTPVLNSGMDIFSQYRILDGGETFGPNFFVFRAQYFYDANAAMPPHRHFPDWRPRPDTYERLNAMIYRKAMRVLKSECLDLPPLIRQEIPIELGAEQRRLYESMRDEFVAYLEDKACVAQLAITKALRLQQIASGHAVLDDGSVHTIADNPRLDALKELLEEIRPEHKVIVWAVFKENYRQIQGVCDELGIKTCAITGEQSSSEKFQAVKDFEEDPSVRVCIANQGAGGVGINLVAASYSIFFSRNFSLEADLQAEARNYRGGSERHTSITRVDLVARDTIDELVLAALSTKQNIAEQILKWKKL